MIVSISGHHAGAHGCSKTELGGCLGIGLSYLRMVGQTQVVVKAPVEHGLAVELHFGTYLTYQAGEHKVTVTNSLILSERARSLFDSLKNVFNHTENLYFDVCNLLV